jgi:hypothetical protein
MKADDGLPAIGFRTQKGYTAESRDRRAKTAAAPTMGRRFYDRELASVGG